MAPPSREELNKLKLPELQRELESRGLDGTGKKVDLVERLWSGLTCSIPVMLRAR